MENDQGNSHNRASRPLDGLSGSGSREPLRLEPAAPRRPQPLPSKASAVKAVDMPVPKLAEEPAEQPPVTRKPKPEPKPSLPSIEASAPKPTPKPGRGRFLLRLVAGLLLLLLLAVVAVVYALYFQH